MRFQPDTLLESLLRPVVMAAPDAGVYVEVMAPDLRFALALAVVVVFAALSVRGRTDTDAPPRRPVLLLLAVLAIAFVPWMATSGNGRYFMAGLLVVGPVAIGLAALLPVTRAMRLALACGMVVLQAFAVQQASPWRAWTLVEWKDPPYFQVDLPPDLRQQPATYVTLSAISYSLVAPMFHPGSRWISLDNAPPPAAGGADARRADAFLSAAQPGRTTLFVPAPPGMQTAQRLPNASALEGLAVLLAPYRLALDQPASCRFVPAPALADIGLGTKTPEDRARAGFWLCALKRVVRVEEPLPSSAASRHDAVFRALESQCPRLFPAGGDAGSRAIPNGAMRTYVKAEMKAYVYDSGEVFYKYYRALNPVRVGRVDEVLGGKARVDCNAIRGRSGLPWDREI